MAFSQVPHSVGVNVGGTGAVCGAEGARGELRGRTCLKSLRHFSAGKQITPLPLKRNPTVADGGLAIPRYRSTPVPSTGPSTAYLR
jgi:hypothetical protein